MSTRRTTIASVAAGFVRVAVLAGLMAPLALTSANAQNYAAMTCRQLWMERNAYFKARGYCFKTDDGIRTFGNEGCYVENEAQIRFTPQERQQIEVIRAMERDRGCR